MALPWGYCEQDANREPLLRYDQWLSDPKQHPEAMRAAAQLVKEATARNLKLNVVTRRLKPEPSWCEQVTATVGQQLPSPTTANAVPILHCPADHNRK